MLTDLANILLNKTYVHVIRPHCLPQNALHFYLKFYTLLRINGCPPTPNVKEKTTNFLKNPTLSYYLSSLFHLAPKAVIAITLQLRNEEDTRWQRRSSKRLCCDRPQGKAALGTQLPASHPDTGLKYSRTD